MLVLWMIWSLLIVVCLILLKNDNFYRIFSISESDLDTEIDLLRKSTRGRLSSNNYNILNLMPWVLIIGGTLLFLLKSPHRLLFQEEWESLISANITGSGIAFILMVFSVIPLPSLLVDLCILKKSHASFVELATRGYEGPQDRNLPKIPTDWRLNQKESIRIYFQKRIKRLLWISAILGPLIIFGFSSYSGVRSKKVVVRPFFSMGEEEFSTTDVESIHLEIGDEYFTRDGQVGSRNKPDLDFRLLLNTRKGQSIDLLWANKFIVGGKGLLSVSAIQKSLKLLHEWGFCLTASEPSNAVTNLRPEWLPVFEQIMAFGPCPEDGKL